MNIWLLLGFLVLQTALLVLDLRESRRESSKRREPIRRSAMVFLALILLLYFCLQLGGSRVLPGPDRILDSVRQISLNWSGQDAATELSTITGLLAGVVLFYVAGFWDYLVHRVFSHSRLFWVTHEYHHLPRQVTVWMPGIFARPFAFVPTAMTTFATTVTFYAVLSLLRLPLWDLRPLLPVALMIALILTASHSAFLRRFAIVHRVMRCFFLTTPQEHLLHHRVDSRCNYGNFTTLWDRLLGTYENPEHADIHSLQLGLSYDQDFLGAVTLGRLRLTDQQRKKFQVSYYCNVDEANDLL